MGGLARCSCVVLTSLTLALSPLQSQSNPSGRSALDSTSVRVDPVNLTEVQERILDGLNIAAVLIDDRVAAGVQKAADVWGLHVDLFVKVERSSGRELLSKLIQGGDAAIITDRETLDGANEAFAAQLAAANQKRGGGLGDIPVIVVGATSLSFATSKIEVQDPFRAGFEALRAARAALLPQIH
jgi:hypothetical protein